MKPTRNLKNILSLFSVDLGTKFLGFLATTYIARILGTSGFGAINIGLAVLVYVQILSSSGLTLLGTKKVAEGRDDLNYLTGDIVSIRFFLTVIVVFAAYLISFFFITSDEIRLIVLAYILYAFPFALLLDWFFSGKQKMEITSAGRIIASLVYLILVIVFVNTPDDLINTAAAWVMGGVANALFIWYLFRRYNYKIKVKLSRYKKSFSLLKEALPLGLASLLSQLAIMFPAIYLGIVSTTSDVGIYSAAYRLIGLFLIFDRVFVTVFFPKMVNTITQIPERMEELFNRTLKIISVFALIISVPMVVGGGAMINFIFGEEFGDSILIFQILVGFFVFTLTNSVFSYTLIAINREKAYIFALTVSLVTFISLVIILYSTYLTLGIAIALIVYEIVQITVMIIKFKETASVTYWTSIVVPAIITLVIIVVILNINIHFLLKILISLCAGIPLVSFAGRLKLEDIKYIKRLMI